MNKANLCTEPDFEEAWIDAPVKFLPKPKNVKVKPAFEVVVISSSTSTNVQGPENEVPIPKKSVEDMASRIKIGMLLSLIHI